MAKQISGVFGFITNSSSAIMHFPAEIMEHPEVKHFIEIYGLSKGFIGDELWHRGRCETLAIGKEQKLEVSQRLRTDGYGDDYYGPSVDASDDGVLLIYGDEYPGLVMTLSDIMRRATNELGLSYYSDEYN